MRCGIQSAVVGCEVRDTGRRLQNAGWVQDEGCSVRDAERRMEDVGCRLQKEGYRVQAAGCRKVDGCRVQISGCRMQNEGCRLQGKGCKVQVAGCGLGMARRWQLLPPLPDAVAGEFSLGFLFCVAKISAGMGISSDNTGICARGQHEVGKEDHTARQLPGRRCCVGGGQPRQQFISDPGSGRR